MKVLKLIGIVLLVGLVIIQFFPTNRNQSDMVPITDFMLVNNVPTELEEMVKTSCYDCHSNNTNYPWYNKVQPIAWFLQGHVEDGKAELNFNEWDDYSERRKKSKLRSIVSQVEEGEMPLASYTLIHGEARLSDAEKKTLIGFITKLKDSL